MLKSLKKALKHGWKIYSQTEKGIFLTFDGDFILFIHWGRSEIEYRGSRNKAKMPLIRF